MLGQSPLHLGVAQVQVAHFHHEREHKMREEEPEASAGELEAGES